MSTVVRPAALIPPTHCQYATGPCNQDFKRIAPNIGFFIYPSEPRAISQTVREAVRQLQAHTNPAAYRSWEDMSIGGNIIFCEICKALRAAKFIVADITTLNFNVLFEIGYAIGLEKHVLPVRDTTYVRDKKLFEELGIFDVLGYESFENSGTLVSKVTKKDRVFPVISRSIAINRKQPIYYLRSPVDSDASIKILSLLRKAYFRFRTFDPRETPRLSLHEAYNHVHSSLTVVAHLMDPNRSGAQVHNARCAFVCGLAMAAKKHVLMLQEGRSAQPIDYRDIVFSYDSDVHIPTQLDHVLRQTSDSLQDDRNINQIQASRFLEKIQIGDVAAENEIVALNNYFIKTPQYHQAATGHARLIVGRKGSGKTAMFYGVRNRLQSDRKNLILDLKPEGHQFVKLRELVISQMTEGLQLHTLTAFWTYLLLLEIAKKVLDHGLTDSYTDKRDYQQFRQLENLYSEHVEEREGDFSERVLRLVNRIISGLSKPPAGGENHGATSITQVIYRGSIGALQKAIEACVRDRDRLWILIDNLDKGWTYLGTHKEDIALLRCLLEATRKLGQWADSVGIEFKSIVFLRKDIHDFLVDHTPDRGKEAVASLDWSDVELFKQLIARRLASESAELNGPFEEVWPRVVNPHIFGENSFNYIVSRTFLRPRDFLNFLRKGIEVAVSRDHNRVEQEDLKTAEVAFSEDMLNDLRYEIRDVASDFPDLLHQFIGGPKRFAESQLDALLYEQGLVSTEVSRVKNLLLWFCFLGYSVRDEERFAYQVHYNLPKLKVLAAQASASDPVLVIHPAFRLALECV